MADILMRSADGAAGIYFPGLGIELNNVPSEFTLFGIKVALYGVIIALGFLLAYMLVIKEAKRTGQKEDTYMDYLLWIIIPSLIGARLYYVIFSWDKFFAKGKPFSEVLLDIINTRNGGMAIYGGIIAGVIVTIIFARKKKLKFSLMTDTLIFGLILGQIIGRFGNFFNREAFGDYTNSLFRMCIPVNYYSETGNLYSLIESGVINNNMLSNLVAIDGYQCISVHPTFLYELLWNVILLVLLMMYRKHKKFDGELTLLYFWGYGLGRVWIEGLRSDSLMAFGGTIKVSQIIASMCVIVSALIIVIVRFKINKNNSNNSKHNK